MKLRAKVTWVRHSAALAMTVAELSYDGSAGGFVMSFPGDVAASFPAGGDVEISVMPVGKARPLDGQWAVCPRFNKNVDGRCFTCGGMRGDHPFTSPDRGEPR